MKKVLMLISIMLLLVSAVSATVTTLTPDDLAMDFVDTASVEFCISDQGSPLDVSVIIDPICKDLNGLVGCNAGDAYNPLGFSVTPDEATTGADGCVDLTLQTNLNPGEEGLFYYTVNGEVGGSVVGSETGQVFVPEFGVVATGALLAGAGLFIARKRKEE